VLEFTEYTSFKDFKEVKQGFVLRYKLFNGIIDLDRCSSEWNEWKIMMMDIKVLSGVRDKYLKDLAAAERGISENQALSVFRTKVEVLKDSIPVIEALRCPYLQDADYKTLEDLLKTTI
jgi:hypothetical protein